MLVCNRVREESFELIKVSDLVFSIFFGLKKVKLLQVVFKFCQSHLLILFPITVVPICGVEIFKLYLNYLYRNEATGICKKLNFETSNQEPKCVRFVTKKCKKKLVTLPL